MGFCSPSTLSTRNDSKIKNKAIKIKGANWYNTYNPTLLFGGFKLLSKCPVHWNPVSRAIYPVPTKRRMADPPINPSDNGVPSSSNWYPTAALSRSIQNVAVMAARCIPVKPYESRQLSESDTDEIKATDNFNFLI
jgi:hypothetical protein